VPLKIDLRLSVQSEGVIFLRKCAEENYLHKSAHSAEMNLLLLQIACRGRIRSEQDWRYSLSG